LRRERREELNVDLIEEDDQRIYELVETAYRITRRAIEELELGATEEEDDITRFNQKLSTNAADTTGTGDVADASTEQFNKTIQ
jgi:hypothetical protein